MKIKPGTRIEVEYSDGYSVTWEAASEFDAGHLIAVIGRLEAIDPEHTNGGAK